MKTLNNFGFIFFPSPKATAYLSIFKELNLSPAVIILMKNPYSNSPSSTITTQEIKDQYFDINYSLKEFSRQFETKIITCDATHINDKNLAQIIDSQKMNTWLFSGGGIVPPSLLHKNYQFLHIHPGQLPEVKGSTCFYYSLLINQSLAASAFFMGEVLDTGETIAISQFSVNLDQKTLTPALMDNIIDPWIRGQVLRKVIENWSSLKSKTLVNRTAVPINRAYYVAHPILRSLALLKTSKNFNVDKKKGVIEIE